jgi:hypothetical protein
VTGPAAAYHLQAICFYYIAGTKRVLHIYFPGPKIRVDIPPDDLTWSLISFHIMCVSPSGLIINSCSKFCQFRPHILRVGFSHREADDDKNQIDGGIIPLRKKEIGTKQKILIFKKLRTNIFKREFSLFFSFLFGNKIIKKLGGTNHYFCARINNGRYNNRIDHQKSIKQFSPMYRYAVRLIFAFLRISLGSNRFL